MARNKRKTAKPLHSQTIQLDNSSNPLGALLQRLKAMGWHDELLHYVSEAGMCGSMGIQGRTGLGVSELHNRIIDNEIGALAIEDESSLFRRISQNALSLFIQLCEEHKVTIITPNTLYQFDHPVVGDYDKRRFQNKAQNTDNK